MDKQPVFLKVYQSGQLVTSRQFLLDQISIGSSSDGPSLVLEDPSVCFWHALIEKRGDSYHISDLGSPTGTFVNSEQVLEAPLKHGDKIKVGNFEIQFFIGVPFARKQMDVKTKVAPSPPPQQESSQELKKKVSEPPPPDPPVKPPPPPKKEEKAPPKEKPPSDFIFSEGKESDSETGVSSPETEQELQKLYTPASSEELVEESSSVKAPGEDKLSPLKRDKEQKEEATGVSVLKKEEVLPSSSVSPPLEDQTAAYEEQPIMDVESVPFTQHSKGTYAPESEVKDLDKDISPGSGSVVEVIVAWKERALSVHHFSGAEQQTVTFGSNPKADIFCTNLVGKSIYTLLKVGQNTVVCLSDGVKASLISNKGKYSFDQLVEKGLITTSGSYQFVSLGQSQLVRLDFSSALRVYVRYSNRVPKAMPAGLFNFSFSEMMGVMMSFFFMSMLVFYLALFSPQFLDSMEDLEEEGIKKASIEFKKKRIIKLKMADAPKKRKRKLSIPNKKAPKKRKKVGIKKRGSKGRLGQVAAKPKEKSKKKTITSARPGGSVTTKKSGAGPRSPRPDPTKVGLLGFFGKKGAQKELDKAYSGTGELAGLAEAATGYAGQKESYTGEGIGTKFKNTGAGGKGSNLIGVSSGIRTKGRGGGTRGYGTGGSLGSRGSVSLSLGTDDWEVEGGIDKNAILRVIRRNKHQLEWCYETALQKKPDLEGKVLLQWDIVNERVRAVKVRANSTRDSILARCLMAKLKRFRFPGTGLKKGQVGEVNIPFAVTKK